MYFHFLLKQMHKMTLYLYKMTLNKLSSKFKIIYHVY